MPDPARADTLYTGVYTSIQVFYVNHNIHAIAGKLGPAAQDPDDPGVLVLSRFAGAAEEMQDAVKEADAGDFATPAETQAAFGKWLNNAG